MKYFRLLLISFLFCCSPFQDLQSEIVYPEGYWEQEHSSNAPLKSKQLSSPPLDQNKQLGFIKVALYLTLGTGLSLLFSFNIPIFFTIGLIFPALIIAGFFWFLGGILAMLAIIMILAKAQESDFVQNQEVAGYLFGLLLLRIIIIIGLGLALAQAELILFLLISALPAFIAYFIGIRRSLKYHRSNKEAKKFWKK